MLINIEKIVCPVDFSEFSTKAFEYAYSLARHYRAKLLLEHVIQPVAVTYPYYAFPATWTEIDWDMTSSAEKELNKLAQRHARNGLQPEFAVHKGVIPESILSFAEEQRADLIVMGTHGRQGIDRVTMGSVTEKVLRKARCPVLAVRKPSHDFVSPEDTVDPVNLRKILFCTDFSDYAHRALTYAFSLAMEYNAELTLLHVLEDVPTETDLQSATAEIARKLAKPIPQDIRNWCTVKPVVRVGKPYQEILQLSLEAQTDLVIMGVRGRNALDLALFGSTTHRVIQLGSCPVLAVHI